MEAIKITDKLREKIIIVILIICLAVCALLCIYQYCRYAVYPKFDLSKEEIADSSQYTWDVESLQQERGFYAISGWIVLNGESIKSHYIQLVIENEDGTCYLAPTSMVMRSDVTNVLNENAKEQIDYDASGFASSLNKRYVHSNDSKIYVLYRNNDHRELVDISQTFAALN